jgi:peptide deformylase
MEPTAMINPELIWGSDDKESGWEGCLSIPGLRGLVPRQRRIGVRYLTRTGELREEEYEGFLARVFQHEFDHVLGAVFIDRVESTRELVTEKEYLRSLQNRV